MQCNELWGRQWGVPLIASTGNNVRETGDYAEATYGRPWNFKDGSFEHIAEIGKGIKNPRVEDGVLRFGTDPEEKKENYLLWDAEKSLSGEKALRIGWNWDLIYWRSWIVEVRMKQSAEQSTLRLSIGDNTMPLARDAVVRGTGWQNVRIQSILAYPLPPRVKLTFEGAGEIFLEHVKIVQLAETVTFRGSVNLPKSVHSAEGWVLTPGAKILINDKEYSVPERYDTEAEPIYMDFTGSFHKGSNRVFVETQQVDATGRNTALAMAVRLVLSDGSLVRFTTGKDWEFKPWVFLQDRKELESAAGWMPASVRGDASVTGERLWRETIEALKTENRFSVQSFETGRLTPAWDIHNPPVFRIKDGISADLRLAPGGMTENRNIRYKVFDSDEKQVLSEGRLAKPVRKSGPEEIYQVRYKPASPGVYVLEARLFDGDTQMEGFNREILVSGPPDQPLLPPDGMKSGMQMTLVDSINLAEPADDRPFVNAGANRESIGVVDTPAGKALSLPFSSSARSYPVKVENPQLPHLGVITYVDEANQMAGISVAENYYHRNSYRQIFRAGTGYVTGMGMPSTGGLKQFSFVFYGGRDALTVQFVNLGIDRVLLVRFDVYDITGGLPAPLIPNDGGREFVYQYERSGEIIQAGYYTGTGNWTMARWHDFSHSHLLRDWWNTWDNAYRHHRHMGHNAIAWMGWMYANPYYDGTNPVLLRNRYRLGIDLGMQIAEDYGMKVYMAHRWLGSPSFYPKDIYTQSAVRAGADTIRCVAGDGTGQIYELYIREQKGYNSFHPVVEQELVDRAAEMASRYAKYPAFGGLLYEAGDYFTPGIYREGNFAHEQSPYRVSYDDSTIVQFEKDTGIRLGVSSADPQRFEKRYAALMEKYKDEWTQWRCGRVAKVVERISEAVEKKAPGIPVAFVWGGFAFNAHADNWYNRQMSINESLRKIGVDFSVLLKNKKAVTGIQYSLFEGMRDRQRMGIYPFQGMVLDTETLSVFPERTPDILFMFDPWYEFYVRPDDTEWIYRYLGNYNYMPRPAGDAFSLGYARMFSNAIPKKLFHGITDCNVYSGGEGDIRNVAALFRSMPEGVFSPVRKPGGWDNVIILEHKGKKVYLFANPAPWAVELNIKSTRRNLRIKDVVTDTFLDKNGDSGFDVSLAAGGMKLVELNVPFSNLEIKSDSVDNEILLRFKSIWKNIMEQSSEIPENYLEGSLKRAQVLRQFKKGSGLLKQSVDEGRMLQAFLHYLSRDCMYVNDVAPRIIEGIRQSGKEKEFTELRVNCGSDKDSRDAKGRVWSADRQWEELAGGWGYTGSAGTAYRGSIEIKDTDIPEIYRSERYRLTGYIFEVPDGRYRVKLHFCETWIKTADSKRVFGIKIQGNTVSEGLNVFAEAGGPFKPVVKEYEVTVNNGLLYMELVALPGFDAPMLNGIELIRE